MSRIKLSIDIVKEFSERPPVDLLGLAHALGISVRVRDDLPNDITGGLIRGDNDKYHIVINSLSQWYMRRFTLAHEIAHYVFHRGWIEKHVYDTYSFESNLSEDRENEANKYAVEILMPSDLVRDKWNELVRERGGAEKVKVHEMAEYFDVAVFSMESRLDNLGLRKLQMPVF